jgi:polyhydroxybutyrate depolymerase
MESPRSPNAGCRRLRWKLAAAASIVLLASGCNQSRNQAGPSLRASTEPAGDAIAEWHRPEIEPAVTAAGELITASLAGPDGSERTYHLYVPSSTAGEPMPLLVAMHGGTGWGEQFLDNSGFDELAEANDFLVAFPDGTRILPRRENAVWNGGACCGVAAEGRRNVDDVGFIAKLIEAVSADYAVDSGRVYATGHSNGAIMSYRLACELSDKIAAVAFQSGSIEIPDCSPTHPVSVMHLHGLGVTNIDIDGGPGSGISSHDFASPRTSIEHMASVNNCVQRSEIAYAANPDVSGTQWSSCDDGTVVELVVVAGANHAWMGHSGSWLQERVTGKAYADLDASAAVWSFLSAQHRS